MRGRGARSGSSRERFLYLRERWGVCVLLADVDDGDWLRWRAAVALAAGSALWTSGGDRARDAGLSVEDCEFPIYGRTQPTSAPSTDHPLCHPPPVTLSQPHLPHFLFPAPPRPCPCRRLRHAPYVSLFSSPLLPPLCFDSCLDEHTKSCSAPPSATLFRCRPGAYSIHPQT